MPRSNELERAALQLILEADAEGILQSEMWKTLGVTSREGSRLALKFEEKGVVERRKVLHGRRWTYKLFSQIKPVTIDSIMDCPCIVCKDLEKCFTGGQLSPLHCPLLTAWVDPNVEIPEIVIEEEPET